MSKKRTHKRLIAPDGTPVLTLGGINKVLDISEGGISLESVEDVSTVSSQELFLDLLSNENIITATKVPGKVVWEKIMPILSLPSRVIRKVGVKFGHLTALQRREIKKLVRNYSKEPFYRYEGRVA